MDGGRIFPNGFLEFGEIWAREFNCQEQVSGGMDRRALFVD